MNCLNGVVERDARPPMVSNGNGFNFFNFSNSFNFSNFYPTTPIMNYEFLIMN